MGVDERIPVDVIVLSRPGDAASAVVVDALRQQKGVGVELHFHTGVPAPSDQSRWDTIARARNQMKWIGDSPWVMFVDDDVVLDPNCIAILLASLQASPHLGAIAADYENELDCDWDGHVGMGACLFRRDSLRRVTFRSAENSCECWCCCDDMRNLGMGITYSEIAIAKHLKNTSKRQKQQPSQSFIDNAVVLAAFDRRDIDRFEFQFLRTLRTWGNREIVVAVAYGLYPSEIRRLQKLECVRILPRLANGVMVPIRRLDDFALVTSQLAPQTPVAYWDVADVVFQASLQPLWREALRTPEKLLAVVEPKGYPENQVIVPWTMSIRNRECRWRAFRLLKLNPFLNSGFAAGSATTLNQYFNSACRMRRGPELAGTTDWGDQLGLNLYCHQDSGGWRAVHEGWNYCIHDRPFGMINVDSRGLISHQRAGKIPVAHGNARSLRQFALLTSKA